MGRLSLSSFCLLRTACFFASVLSFASVVDAASISSLHPNRHTFAFRSAPFSSFAPSSLFSSSRRPFPDPPVSSPALLSAFLSPAPSSRFPTWSGAERRSGCDFVSCRSPHRLFRPRSRWRSTSSPSPSLSSCLSESLASSLGSSVSSVSALSSPRCSSLSLGLRFSPSPRSRHFASPFFSAPQSTVPLSPFFPLAFLSCKNSRPSSLSSFSFVSEARQRRRQTSRAASPPEKTGEHREERQERKERRANAQREGLRSTWGRDDFFLLPSLRELRAAASALLAASAGVEEGTLGQAERPETSGAASFWTPQSRRGSPTELPKKVISLCHQLRSWEAANEHLAHLDAELGALEASRARRKDISREDANGGEGVRDGELAGRTDKGDREKEQQEEEELSLLLQHEREATQERLREVEASIEVKIQTQRDLRLTAGIEQRPFFHSRLSSCVPLNEGTSNALTPCVRRVAPCLALSMFAFSSGDSCGSFPRKTRDGENLTARREAQVFADADARFLVHFRVFPAVGCFLCRAAQKTALLPEKESRNENVAIVEIRPAAGGEEAQLWATDLAEVRNMGRKKKTHLHNQEIFFSSFKHAWRHPISSTKLRLHLATHVALYT
ncbi:peptidyl-tRNA hydrolase domain-containing protein [Toxoplasma gondii MAS]|uniref:Peptidyl-tRNA hydrolase domain-containing protein n=1 Tax=Toxoplasma gondii MAS TaxID=943118 RepID=A0A086QSQ2_TOXGO|nr:peptidyl-tRNA hydrolase domain-containing protein [Toxoplasma gondii MAS]